ncbi:MAG: Rrf2 family transcriptional regulator [Pseudomonadota bacterium]|nr:Rrf2 family transcriptional regulator [Pseudomonadota bacterium]
MNLSSKGWYAVKAVVIIAQNKNRPISLEDIGSKLEISLSYLEQLFSKLRRGNLVKGVRGPGGGYVLLRPANKIFIYDIFRSIEETFAVEPFYNYASQIEFSKEPKEIQELRGALGNQISGYLKSVSVSDICDRHIKPVIIQTQFSKTDDSVSSWEPRGV